MSELSLRMIEMVSDGLGELNEEVAFVGGAVTGIYADDPASEEARPTEDVDCVLRLASFGGYICALPMGEEERCEYIISLLQSVQ